MQNKYSYTRALILAGLVARCSQAAFDATAADSASSPAGFANYTEKIPGGSVKFDMIAIPGGTITIGSSADEAGREKSDLPQKSVTVKSFWMGKCEVAWEEIIPYIFVDSSEIVRNVDKIEGLVDKDGVSHPTKPYGSVYRERGEKGYPAIGMGYPTAREFCKWLSKKTGHNYRLPTEEEWEFACRAGSNDPYFWGKDAAKAKEYAWFKDNSNETTHPVGKLKPNAFGLHDMAGNVAEWTVKSANNQPGVVRGGAWSEPVEKLRSAARMIEIEDWNELDPQSPQSVWWLSAADFVGFRVVRSFEDAPAASEKAESPKSEAPAAAATAKPGSEIAALYKKLGCAGCHGEDGKGKTKLGIKTGARDYTDAKVKASLKDEDMIKGIKEGVKVDGKVVMHALPEGKATEAEIKALAEYMKKF